MASVDTNVVCRKWVLGLGLGLGVWLLPAQAGGPIAPVREVTTPMHGVDVKDPYRYLENVQDPQVRAWMLAQGDDTRQTLDRLAVRGDILKRLQERDAVQGDVVRDVVRTASGQVYYLKRFKGERQFKLVVRPSLSGAERVLVDPEQLAKATGVPHAINYFVPSWDGKHVAYGLSAGGSEDASLYVLNLASGKPVGQPIPRVPHGDVGWLPDSRSFAYTQLQKLKPGDPDTEVYMDSRVLWLKLGQSETSAVPIFGPTVTTNLGLGRLDFGHVQFQPGSRWMVARTTDTTVPEGFLFVAKVADTGRKPVPWKKLSQFDDRIIDVALKGDDAYLLTYAKAPRNRVLRLNLHQPQLAKAREVAVPPEGTVLDSFMLSKDAIVAKVREGTSVGLRRYPLKAAVGDVLGKAVPMPYPGAATLATDLSGTYADLLYTHGGWTQPPRRWLFDGQRNQEVQLGDPVVSPQGDDVEVSDVTCKSHDGAMVPMTLLHKKGLQRDGKNPTLLVGYGAYGHSETARYNTAEQTWIERGGVSAHVNVRGSGVYGQDWYRAGHKATKPNTWKDGIACARFLIDQGYASPATLAVMGGSAGGIFAGRSVTAAPELFAAGVLFVGVMDAVRAEESANGITNLSEFGSAKVAAEFPALLEMSTYHQIRDGVAYPAVMLVHGLNDPRVDVWHSAKAAARFQAASSSGKPVMLRLDPQAGHGIGSTNTQRQGEIADVYSFLLWQMGRASLTP